MPRSISCIMICLVLIHLFSLLVCPALGNFRLYQTYTNIPQLAVHDGEGILAGRFLDGFGSPSCDMVENATLYESIPDLNQGMGIAFRWDEPDEYKGSVEFNVPWGHYSKFCSAIWDTLRGAHLSFCDSVVFCSGQRSGRYPRCPGRNMHRRCRGPFLHLRIRHKLRPGLLEGRGKGCAYVHHTSHPILQAKHASNLEDSQIC